MARKSTGHKNREQRRTIGWPAIGPARVPPGDAEFPYPGFQEASVVELDPLTEDSRSSVAQTSWAYEIILLSHWGGATPSYFLLDGAVRYTGHNSRCDRNVGFCTRSVDVADGRLRSEILTLGV